MKSKKGFTLIELLAIIVILAIIAVITVPIILNIIDDSKKGAATDSAYGYKDAVNNWYLEKLSSNFNYKLDGTYKVRDGRLNGQEISVSGAEPSIGYLVYENNVIKDGCLTFDEYRVIFENGKVKTTEKGVCSQIPFVDSDSDGVISRYDIVSIGNEQFYVLEPENTDGDITLLAKTCLINDSDILRQKVEGESCTAVQFARNGNYGGYWKDKVGEGLAYPGQYCTSQYQTNCAYVYYAENSNSSVIDDSVDSYTEALSQNARGRVLSLEEANGLDNDIRKLEGSSNQLPYWIGSAYNEVYVWIVYAGGILSHPTDTYNMYSVRPVIIIPMSEL